jgi:hypothetical protein
VHNGTNSMRPTVQNENLGSNSGMNSSSARPALLPPHSVSSSETRLWLQEAKAENTLHVPGAWPAGHGGSPQRREEDGDQLAIYRETRSEAVDGFRPEVKMRRSTLSFFEQLLAGPPFGSRFHESYRTDT